jgi:SAM-dependent methyltransferase
MTMPAGPSRDPLAFALLSGGQSSEAVLKAVHAVLRGKRDCYGVLVDLGCGRGDCARSLEGLFGTYIGCDVYKYQGFPERGSVQFRPADLNRPPYPVDDSCADAVISIETVEHLENPRALVREMARIVRPGGLVVVTTPNQLSVASKAFFFVRNQFPAFQEAPGLYPAHITALLAEDLKRIARECELTAVEIRYSEHGRIPLTATAWPKALAARGRWFSDNVLLVATRP